MSPAWNASESDWGSARHGQTRPPARRCPPVAGPTAAASGKAQRRAPRGLVTNRAVIDFWQALPTTRCDNNGRTISL
jgi:hypothetical protein